MRQKTVQSAITADATTGEQLPFVSVVMPIRNEAGFIACALESLFSQDYPADRVEIIVADGMSNDGTRQIVTEIAHVHPQVRMIDNPGRIVPTGLNAGIAQAKGEIVIRLDGHAEIAPDFIRQNIALFAEHPEAWVVGGPIVHSGRNRFARAAAAAMSSRFGVGMAYHRFADYEGYAEEAAFPAVRGWVFDRIGNFDEALVRNQDDEFCFRVNQAGGKVFISPRVRYAYFVRDTPRKLFRQYFQYSFWRIPMIRKHKRPTTGRQVVPSLFFLTMFVLLMVGLWLEQPLVAFTLPFVYLAALLLIGLSVAPRTGLVVASLVPLALVIMHFSYALGLSWGFVAAIVYPRAWDPGGSMSALSR
ncbi:MAG: glycosyltransferase family 2 protein [Pirellulales bacterium]